LSPATTTILDGSATFGAVGTGGSVVSTDTFSFRQDRAVAFNWANIRWTISAQIANRPPVANAGPDQGIAGVGATVHLNGAGSSDPDGNALQYVWTFTSRPIGSAAALVGAATG